MDDIIELKIMIQGSNPKIWRRVQVHKETTFFELHHIIQITMGWMNYHMYEFCVNGYLFSEPPEENDNAASDLIHLDSDESTLESIIVNTGELFSYLYDFGDGWIHAIRVEQFMPGDKAKKYPTCSGGELACPPEDSGGLKGYYNMLKILKDKKHPEYKDTRTWLGRNFNPAHFDKEKVNMQLSGLDKYINDWLDKANGRIN